MWKISLGAETVTAEYDQAMVAERAVLVCAHGAGGNLRDRGVTAVASALSDAGIGVVRFNFPYSESRRGRPDPMPTLTSCVSAVVARVRAELTPRRLIIGGRSLGGRAASMLAAEGFDADGLLLLAYPLHPPGRPQKLRDAHLPSITMPVLCFSGTRDDYCDRQRMEAVLRRVRTRWTMHWLEGADHGFRVLKSSGRSGTDLIREVASAARIWIDSLT